MIRADTGWGEAESRQKSMCFSFSVVFAFFSDTDRKACAVSVLKHLKQCVVFSCVPRAHWFLVVVCFPGLEDIQFEKFQSPTGELPLFDFAQKTKCFWQRQCPTASTMIYRASLIITRRHCVVEYPSGLFSKTVLGYLGTWQQLWESCINLN